MAIPEYRESPDQLEIIFGVLAPAEYIDIVGLFGGDIVANLTPLLQTSGWLMRLRGFGGWQPASKASASPICLASLAFLLSRLLILLTEHKGDNVSNI